MDIVLSIFQDIKWESIIATSIRIMIILAIVFIVKKVVKAGLEKFEEKLV